MLGSSPYPLLTDSILHLLQQSKFGAMHAIMVLYRNDTASIQRRRRDDNFQE